MYSSISLRNLFISWTFFRMRFMRRSTWESRKVPFDSWTNGFLVLVGGDFGIPLVAAWPELDAGLVGFAAFHSTPGGASILGGVSMASPDGGSCFRLSRFSPTP